MSKRTSRYLAAIKAERLIREVWRTIRDLQARGPNCGRKTRLTFSNFVLWLS